MLLSQAVNCLSRSQALNRSLGLKRRDEGGGVKPRSGIFIPCFSQLQFNVQPKEELLYRCPSCNQMCSAKEEC